MGEYSVLRRLHPNLLLNDTPRLVTCYLQLVLWVLDHVFAHYLKEFHTRLFDGFKFGSACFFALVKQHAITLHHEHRTGLHSSFSFTWWFKNKEAIHFKIKTVTSTFLFCLLFSNIWKSQSCQIWNGGGKQLVMLLILFYIFIKSRLDFQIFCVVRSHLT